jgi:protein gp37
VSTNTPIEWTVTVAPDGTRYRGMTFNPWWGCTKVSPACKHCYAERLAARFNRGEWTPTGDRAPASEATWAEPLAWNRKAQKLGVRLKVFCASMADVFEDRADLDPLRERLWRLIAATPHLDWLLLTKRPDVMVRWAKTHPWPGNAWAGTTVESQEWADRRIPALLQVPAPVRFLSCEPLLGAVALQGLAPGESMQTDLYREWLTATGPSSYPYRENGGIHWVIAGGESGPNARPSHPDWFRSLRDQCAAAGVPFHFKQWGEWAPQPYSLAFYRDAEENRNDRPPVQFVGSDGATAWADRASMPNACPVAKVGKANAGRLLDGAEHNDYPKVSP